jgi:circadian clock protein KaiB
MATKSLPLLYKGLALFTPGGDVVYCIDPTKQRRWHHQLCTALQEWLELPEPPLFLSPCYTATIDCWFDAQQQRIVVLAEAYPSVLAHQAHLNTLFDTGGLVWHPVSQAEEHCDPLVLESYRSQFPQLWESHNLVIRLDANETAPREAQLGSQPGLGQTTLSTTGAEGYTLRLFVAGSTPTTEQILTTLHGRLADLVTQPYTLQVIDVLKQPEQAEADQVAATPTLVKAWPPPVRRLVGDLDQPEKLARLLM